VLNGKSVDHVAISFDAQETQDSADDMTLYWWTNDVLCEEIVAQVDHPK